MLLKCGFAVVAAVVASATLAAAQMPPPNAPPMIPNPNPMHSFTVPQAPEVPVSPALPSAGPGAAAVSGGGLAGTNEVVNPPHSVFHRSATRGHVGPRRRFRYARHFAPQ